MGSDDGGTRKPVHGACLRLRTDGTVALTRTALNPTGIVKVIPKARIAEYRKARLVSRER